jgi:hypothetical protein
LYAPAIRCFPKSSAVADDLAIGVLQNVHR